MLSIPTVSHSEIIRVQCIPHRLDFVNQPLTVAMGSGASSGDRSVDVKSFLEALLGETLLASTGVVETDKAPREHWTILWLVGCR